MHILAGSADTKPHVGFVDPKKVGMSRVQVRESNILAGNTCVCYENKDVFYNKKEQAVSKINYSENDCGDLVGSSFESFEYNEQGNETRHSILYDDNLDGEIDAKCSTKYIYDSSGHVLSEVTEVDSDYDGVIDKKSSISYKYDANGFLALERKVDENSDGKIVYSRTRTYNKGLIEGLKEYRDLNGDGKLELSLDLTFIENICKNQQKESSNF